jgi:uncharacterized protein CbrC (UPF0167 family)
MELPVFRYHPDPLGSASVIASTAKCRCCKKSRGHIYTASVYSEEELTEALCPWCIADGSAYAKFDATFVDTEAFTSEIPEAVLDEVTQRTPGFSTWQSERWPVCCNDATAFLAPAGIAEIRANYRDLEYNVLSYIIHDLEISGGAATRTLESLKKDSSPTAYLFRCLHCQRHHFHIDSF